MSIEVKSSIYKPPLLTVVSPCGLFRSVAY